MKKNPKHTLKIDGMTCTNCSFSVERAIKKLGGQEINVNFSTGEASFTGDIDIKEVKSSIRLSGFTIIKNENEKKNSKVKYLFLISCVFTIPLMLHMVVEKESILNNPILQLALTIPVILSGGVYFLKSAYFGIKTRVLNMNVLVSMGFLSAFFYSVYGAFVITGNIHDYLFFETTAAIITLVLLGNLLEENAIKKTTSALSDLEELRPRIARRVSNGKQIERVKVEELKIDDFIRINNGDKLPVDGIIASGELELDEKLITGESIPVFKNTLTDVISGTTVISGSALVRVTKGFGESTIDQIIDLVKNAQIQKPKIQKLGDKISAIFVPTVIGASILAFFLNLFVLEYSLQTAIMNSIAVLVISCPCAMGLAAPTAVMVGIGKLAKNGVLIKGGATLEKLASADLIVFDKTGTLTTGEFILNKLNCYKESEEKIKQVILSLEQQSNHPIAESLVKALNKEVGPIYLQDVIEIRGKGVKGTDTEGNLYQLVSNQYSKTLTSRELTSDLVLFNGTSVVAELWIKDQAKIDAEETINWLKSNGYRTMLLSGDRRKNCDEIARELYLDDFYYEKSPEEKLKIIEKLNKNHNVIMVGDGINDAPSLALAHVGVSFGSATDIAINSSEVILVDKKLDSLKTALLVGKQTYRTIQQNFFWAFFYNIIAIPIAALGFLKPMIAALAMAFSDVVVIGNSLLLKIKRN
ncbi:MAG: Cu+-exporting ATPase [Flavobacteriales bacterium]|jgi:Cu+-exporting ATPase|tara:strand:+ start:3443 stop:5539 length:2097 start_codon:yes stop_codon:yes gene_type:complete